MEAFNRDMHIWNEFMALAGVYNVEMIIETGTYKAQSTIEFANLGLPVHTIEKNEKYFEEARIKLKEAEADNVYTHLGDSPTVLDRKILPVQSKEKRMLFFLDAHWYNDNCLTRELEVIEKHFQDRTKPIIMIHDFKVPGKPEFGYDTHDGKVYEWSWVKEYIKRIYGEDGYSHWYNTGVPDNGNPRGCVFIVPKE